MQVGLTQIDPLQIGQEDQPPKVTRFPNQVPFALIAVFVLLIIGQHLNAELRWPDPVYAPDDDVNIIIDGELTESEWKTAQVYQDQRDLAGHP